jgi:hypothetical protein
MKLLPEFLAAAFSMTVLLFTSGCSHDENAVTQPRVINVSVNLERDTLRFFQCNTGSMPITVHVWDEAGNAIPGVKVEASVTEWYGGMLEYADSTLQDTTDSTGNVRLIFRTQETGNSIITAACEGESDKDTIVAIAVPTVYTLDLQATPDTVHYLVSDVVRVTMVVSPWPVVYCQGIPIISFRYHATGGRMVPIAPDSMGYYSYSWYLPHATGTYCQWDGIGFGHAVATDSFCVYVEP